MDNQLTTPPPQASQASQAPLQAHQLVRRTIALVLAGGRGSRLKQLTDRRAKPAVYFGGKFRIIDFALSNCLNSGIRRMAVVTQYKSHSLMRHLQRGWSFLRAELNEMVDVLPAQQRVGDEHWYRGTADAVFQNLDIIQTRSTPHDYVVVLAGDHIYKMDYSIMVKDHAERGLRLHGRLHRGAAHGGHRLRRDGRRRRTGRSPPFSKSRPTRPPCPAGPTWRWPAWASTCSIPSTSTSCWKKTTPTPIRATTSARTSFRSAVAAGRARWRIRSACRA
jgi:hypothetical protein